MRRSVVTDEQVQTASAELSLSSALRARDWPADLKGLDTPGLYAWFVDRSGVRELTTGYGVAIRVGLAYIGEAGVGTEADLRERVECHLWKCTVRRSTLRRTLTCGLLQQRGWKVVAHRTLASGFEQQLSDWMASHLRVRGSPIQRSRRTRRPRRSSHQAAGAAAQLAALQTARYATAEAYPRAAEGVRPPVGRSRLPRYVSRHPGKGAPRNKDSGCVSGCPVHRPPTPLTGERFRR